MIIKYTMPTSWLISPALSPDMHDRDLWENFEVSLKVLNSKMIIFVTRSFNIIIVLANERLIWS